MSTTDRCMPTLILPAFKVHAGLCHAPCSVQVQAQRTIISCWQSCRCLWPHLRHGCERLRCSPGHQLARHIPWHQACRKVRETASLLDLHSLSSAYLQVIGNHMQRMMWHRCCGRAMREHAVEGAIVNVASVAGTDGGYAPAAYTASKFGVVGLTKQVRGGCVQLCSQCRSSRRDIAGPTCGNGAASQGITSSCTYACW